MLYAAIATDLLILITQTILPNLGIYFFPKVAQLFILIWIFGIWRAMVKYKFMAPSPSLTSNEIISHINEMVVILSAELNISMTNDKFLELLSMEEGKIKNKNIFEFIHTDDEIIKCFKFLTEGKEERLRCKIYYKNIPEPIRTDSYISRVTDQFSDLIGILVISKENRGIKQLQKVYNITKRETDIIELTVSGISNHDIALKLEIAERTVESHMNNIYNKMGIGSKIELLNIAYDFNIIQNEKI